MAALVRCQALASSSAARGVIRCLSTTSVRAREGPHVDMPTHTGQVYEKDDYRRIRFMDKDKLVNSQFAIDLVAKEPVVVVNDNHVYSDGGGALGHPKVYINLDKPEIAVCGYSGRKFISKHFYDEKKHGKSILYEQYKQEPRS